MFQTDYLFSRFSTYRSKPSEGICITERFYHLTDDGNTISIHPVPVFTTVVEADTHEELNATIENIYEFFTGTLGVFAGEENEALLDFSLYTKDDTPENLKHFLAYRFLDDDYKREG